VSARETWDLTLPDLANYCDSIDGWLKNEQKGVT